MHKGPSLTASAAQTAAHLLRRIGFIVLATAPIFSQVSRRGFVIVVPLGAILLLVARMIESDGQAPFHRMRDHLTHQAAWPILFFMGWAGLSLIWTPFFSEALMRYGNLVALSLLIYATIQSLDDHSRIANLNLLPIGLAASLILSLGLHWQAWKNGDSLPDLAYAERFPVLTTLLLSPACAWLISRRRYGLMLLLLACATLALLLADANSALIALALSLAIMVLSFIRPHWATLISLVSTAILVMIAPLLPFLLRPFTKWVYGSDGGMMDALKAWGRLVQKEPLRLITGHGFDVTMRAKMAGMIEATAPRGLLFEIWYELGLLGVGALAWLFVLIIRSSRHLSPPLAASCLASLIGCFYFAVAGQASMQAWWLTLIGLVLIHLTAILHGQYHTRRPISRKPALTT